MSLVCASTAGGPISMTAGGPISMRNVWQVKTDDEFYNPPAGMIFSNV